MTTTDLSYKPLIIIAKVGTPYSRHDKKRPDIFRLGRNKFIKRQGVCLYYVLTTEEIWSCGPKYPQIYFMDTDLNVIGYKILPLINSMDFANCIVSTADGGCLVGISYDGGSSGNCTYHILKFPITDFVQNWSVDEIGIDNQVSKVYPNPATNALHLNIDGDATLSITDIQGRRLLEKNVSDGDNKIDISELRSGMYIYQVSGSNSENKTGKFIKK